MTLDKGAKNKYTAFRSFLSLITSPKNFKQKDPARLTKKEANPVSK